VPGGLQKNPKAIAPINKNNDMSPKKKQKLAPYQKKKKEHSKLSKGSTSPKTLMKLSILRTSTSTQETNNLFLATIQSASLCLWRLRRKK
jgi:hypothetical protein